MTELGHKCISEDAYSDLPSKMEALADVPIEYLWEFTRNEIWIKYRFLCCSPEFILIEIKELIEVSVDVDHQISTWKFGIIDSQSEPQFEIKYNPDKPTDLDLKIKGKNRFDFYETLTSIIEEIIFDEKYEKAKPQKLIACRCKNCANEYNTPHFFRMKELQDRYRNTVNKIRCKRNYFKEVSVKKILKSCKQIPILELDIEEQLISIQNGKLIEVINRFLLTDIEKDDKVELIMKKTNLNKWEEEKRKGTISEETYETNRNKVVNFLLKFIQDDDL